MARCLSNGKLLSALVDSISVSINRRGYAAASQGVVASSMKAAGKEKKTTRKESSVTNSWGPDPVTGYYRPENYAAETDVARLREEMFLNQKSSRQL